MIKALQEFTVDNCEFTFRFSKIKPTTLLALTSSLSLSELKTSERVFDFILEHTEANLNGEWHKVKQGEVFMPPVLEEQMKVLMEIITKFMKEFLEPVFTNSVE